MQQLHNMNRRSMTQVRDKDGSILGNFCMLCDGMTGVDDSMDMKDFINLLQTGNVRAKACPKCGNQDPFEMTFRDNGNGLALDCDSCDYSWSLPTENDHHTDAKATSADVAGKGEEVVPDKIELSCTCGNTDSSLLQVGTDRTNGHIIYIQCLVCTGAIQFTDVKGDLCGPLDTPKSVSPILDEYGVVEKIHCAKCTTPVMKTEGRKLPAADNYKPGRTRIKTAQLLQTGDHIAWHQFYGYWHHGIVVRVSDVLDDKVRVIQYNGPLKTGPPKFIGGEIREEWQDIYCLEEEVYRIDYDPDICYTPAEVVKRARTRVGEKAYNLLLNNCEHFARWSKIGSASSVQVQSFTEALMKGGKQVTTWAGKAFIKYLTKSGTPGVVSKGAISFTDIAVSEAVVSGVLAIVELGAAAKDIGNSYTDYKKGILEKDEFVNVYIKRGTQGVSAVAGSFVGGRVGAIVGGAIALPLVGALVGRTLGYLLGQAAGALLGKQIVHAKDQLECYKIRSQWMQHNPYC